MDNSRKAYEKSQKSPRDISKRALGTPEAQKGHLMDRILHREVTGL